MKIKNKLLICAMIFALITCCLTFAACNLFGSVTVNFHPNYEGATVKSYSYGAFDSREIPSAPERSGYKFDGWFVEENCTTPLTQSILDDAEDGATFYAKWTALPKSLEAHPAVGLTLYTGDVLTNSNLDVFVTYHDDNKVGVASSNFTFSGYNAETAGEQTLTVSYTENGTTVTCPVTINVTQLEVTSITATLNPNRAVCVGDEYAANIVEVVAHYNNGGSVTLTYDTTAQTDYTVQNFNTATVGEMTFKISFSGVDKDVTVNVQPLALDSITAQYVGSSVPMGLTLDESDFAVTARYINGSTANVVYPSYSVGTFSSEEMGEQTVTISYTEGGVTKTADVIVGVVDAIVTNLQVALTDRIVDMIDEQYVSTGVFVGDEFDVSLFYLTAQYSDGTITHPTDYSVVGFDTSAAVQIEITVCYDGVTETFEFTVQEVTLVGISAKHDGTVFTQGSTFRPTTMTVLAWYSNGSSIKLKSGGGANGYNRSGFSTTTVGVVYGTVTYKDYSKKVYYTVVEGGITGVEATYVGETIYDGDQLLNDNFKVLLVYDGTVRRATTDFTVTGFNSQTIGEQTLTVTYVNGDNTYTTTIGVTVERRTIMRLDAVYDGTVNKGEQLDLTKLTVTAIFNNGTSEVITAPALGVINTSTVGVKELQVSCDWHGQTPDTTVNITVLDPATAMGGNLSIHFLELGNIYAGDCTYIKAGDTDILIDAGSRASSAETIANYVNQFCTDGVLEYVIATHAHQDHIEGFVGSSSCQGIFARYRCQTIIDFNGTNQKLETAKGQKTLYSKYLDARNAEVSAGANRYSALECANNANGAQKVYNLTEDGSVTMEILYQDYYEKDTSNENNYSVCLMIREGNNNYLFTGDLEDAGEASLVKNNPNLPNVVLYKGGHHGSYTAASEELLEKIQPQNVCICCCAGSVEYTKDQDNTFPAQAFINRVSVYTENVYVTSLAYTHQDASGKWVNDGFTSMNGNIVVTYKNGQVVVRGSNNSIKLKDTEWFATHRQMPPAWQNGTSKYR